MNKLLSFLSKQSVWTLSVIFLILANLVPVVLVLFFNWDVGYLIYAYWLETVIIGGFNLLKMWTISLFAKREEFEVMALPKAGKILARLLPAIFLSAFFSVHFGIFMFAHRAFLDAQFGISNIPLSNFTIVIFAFVISHLVSFITNFVGKKEYEKTAPQQQMFMVYGRIIVMHLFIIFGGIGTQMFPNQVLLLLFFILLKTILDIGAHNWSHQVKKQAS